MTQLLISVRDAAEAQSALAGGVDWIDVKEPIRGALGFADGETLRAIAASVGKRLPLSAALGEISQSRPATLWAALEGYQFAKFGLAGATDCDDWPRRWQAALSKIPSSVKPVAVIYADWRSCAAPPPREVLRRGCDLGCAAMLIDTFAKQGSTTLDLLSSSELAELIDSARDQQLITVLAGSLQIRDLPRCLSLNPDIIAVRGAACRGGRSGVVDVAHVKNFREELARHSLLEMASAKCRD